MIEHCVYDRIVVTSGHTHRSSYAVLVNNGNTHMSYSQSMYKHFTVDLHGLSTISKRWNLLILLVSTIHSTTLAFYLSYALIDYEFCIQLCHYARTLLITCVSRNDSIVATYLASWMNKGLASVSKLWLLVPKTLKKSSVCRQVWISFFQVLTVPQITYCFAFETKENSLIFI